MPPAVEPLPPTDPAVRRSLRAPPAVPTPPPVAKTAASAYLIRGAGWAAMLLLLVAIITTEGVAWVAAERFRHSLDGIDGRPLAETRASYEGIRARSMLGTGLHLRVDRLLRSRLVAMADDVIADYRRDEPTMTGPDWRLAQQALRWATQISPGRSTTPGKAPELRRARDPPCGPHAVCVGGPDDLSPSSRKVPGGRRSRWRLVRPVSGNQPDCRLRSGRRRPGGFGDSRGRKARIRLRTP